MVTGRYGITDHYAVQSMKLGIPMNDFIKFCSTVKGLYRDNFDKIESIFHFCCSNDGAIGPSFQVSGKFVGA